MRLFIRSILVLLFVANPVFGQLTGLKVDSSTMPASDIAEIVINQESGELVITSINGVEYEVKEKSIVPGSVVINSFTVNSVNTATVPIGGSATLRWSTTNAATCSASADPAVADWNAVDIGVGPKSVNFPTGEIYNLFLDCTGDDGSTASATVTARVGVASISSFTVNPSSANKGSNQTLTFSWTSTNTSNCYGSWPNSNDLPSSGSASTDVINIQPGANYTLTCINLYSEDDDSVVVTVTDPQPVCNVSLTSRRDNNWASLFGTDWPGPANRDSRRSIPDTGYYAIRFETGTVKDTGAVSTFEASGTSGRRLLAISEIPGCFDVPTECRTGGRATTISWNSTGSGVGCPLKPNTVYYWNVTFTDGVTPGTSTCLGTNCETYLWVVNSDY